VGRISRANLPPCGGDVGAADRGVTCSVREQKSRCRLPDAAPENPETAVPWPPRAAAAECAAGLVFLDRDAAFADLDLDAGALLVLIDHVADDGGADGDNGDDDIEGLAGHAGIPVGGTKGADARHLARFCGRGSGIRGV